MSNRDVYFNADGTKSTVHWDEKGVDIVQEQRVDDIIEGFRHESALGHNKIAAGRLSARVPITLHYQWVAEWQEKYSDTWELKTYLAMKVNSSDFKNLRNQVIRG